MKFYLRFPRIIYTALLLGICTSCAGFNLKKDCLNGCFLPVYDEYQYNEFPQVFAITVAARNSGYFQPFENTDLALTFDFIIRDLVESDIEGACEWVRELRRQQVVYQIFRIMGLDREIYGFMEAVLPGHPYYKGWGAVLVKPQAEGYVVVQAPHAKFELYTRDIALETFYFNTNSAFLMISGAHRYSNGDGDGDGAPDSDVAHDPDSLFHQIFINLAVQGVRNGRPYWFIQFHGAYDRLSEPTIVASNGASIPVLMDDSELVVLDDFVDQ